MIGLVVDTHAIVWYLLRSPRITQTAFNSIEAASKEGGPIWVPSICLVEIIYLREKGRIPREALAELNQALDDPASAVSVYELDRKVACAIERVPRDEVPDMPDRIIAATALHLNLPLVSRDKRIRLAGIETIW